MPAVNPQILVWARKTAGLTLQDAVAKVGIRDARGVAAIDRLTALERGEERPTRPTLVKMAHHYRRPLLAFYLKAPPRRDDRGRDFRTLPGARSSETEAIINALVRNLQSRQRMVRAAREAEDETQAIQFDEEGITRVVKNLNELVAALPAAVQKCLAWFSGVDRTVVGYEGLIAAQECLPDNEKRDRFAADYSYLARLWDAISPDPSLEPYESDYAWLGQVYESLKPSTGTGKLLWHTLGAKTIDLIHRHVHVEAVRDDLETLVLDADVLDAVIGTKDPAKKSKEIEIRVAERLRRYLRDPQFRALGERLEELRRKHEQGLLVSIEFLKSLLELARDVVEAERTVKPATPEERGKAALTELFEEARNDRTPIMVERIVNDIDEIVRHVRFEGWQTTHAGEREVKQALRKTLFKYRLHQDKELFDRAYGYVRQYY